MDGKRISSSPGLTAATVARAREQMGEEPAVLLPFRSRCTGDAAEVLVVSDETAEDLAGMLGYFGLPETVAIFAASCTADLAEDDIAALIGGDRAELRAEIERMVDSGILVRWESDGTAFFSAGNPPLKRFFVNKFAPQRKKRF